MTEPDKQPLRPFQERILRLVLQRKNVIVQAPTGAGKTWGALAPYFQNLARRGNALPLTCLYATPMRVLSTQFYQKYRSHMLQIDKLRGTDFVRLYNRLERAPVSLQTGEQPEDPAFESLLTFCTIDQLLASFLAVPYSLGGRFGNLNVGAIVGSYLVLDEFHLFPLTKEGERCYGARTTTIAMLQKLSTITPFVLMTATFSSTLLGDLKKLLNAKVVTITDEKELQALAPGRRRRFEVAGSEMSVHHILERHESCSLVVCNTVLRAQDLYWRLKSEAKARQIEIVLLHSRLQAEDRRQRAEQVMRELGPAPEMWTTEERYGWKDGVYYGKNLIVIATQVVEVGLDISVQTLHTEIAPANSLIQRAGRCARFAHQEGTVIVYDLPLNMAGFRVSARPYNEKLCTATFAALEHLAVQQIERGEDHVGFLQEQALINAVHTEEDRDLLARYRLQHDYIHKRIIESLAAQHRSVVSELIRDVAQVQIIIHNQPQNTIQKEPWRWQSFTMHPASLASRIPVLHARAKAQGLSWVCKEAVAPKEEQEDETDTRHPTRFTWVDIDLSGTVDELTQRFQATLMIALPATLATYHPELGFVLLDGSLDMVPTGYQSPYLGDTNKPHSSGHAIQVQSYKEHIQGLVNAYNHSIRPSLSYGIGRLETFFQFPQGSIDHAIRLALACHDLGKLSEEWQYWALEWQCAFYARQGWSAYEVPSGAKPFFFAKTDFNGSQEQWQWQQELGIKRPHHACESVAIGMNLIRDSLGVSAEESPLLCLLYATLGAIARHHSPRASTHGAVRLQPGAVDAVREALEVARQNLPWHYELAELDTSFIESDDLAPTDNNSLLTLPRSGRRHEGETWLYFLLSRALRLADQRADRFRDNR